MPSNSSVSKIGNILVCREWRIFVVILKEGCEYQGPPERTLKNLIKDDWESDLSLGIDYMALSH